MAVNGGDSGDDKMAVDNDSTSGLRHRVEDDVLASINQSAMSILRSTCLAAKPRRWRHLRKASRSLLAVAMPDAESRDAHVDRAHVEEARRALLGGGTAGSVWSTSDTRGDGFMGGGGDSRQVKIGAYLSPVMLRRVARLCRKVCARRSQLLRDELAPALAQASKAAAAAVASPVGEVVTSSAAAVNDSNDEKVKRTSFVFPALVQRFWECCVWRRDDGESMEAVLFDILRLAVHEMRAAGAAVAGEAASQAVKDSGGIAGGEDSSRESKVPKMSEEEMLRAGLGELMPLLQSNVARVAQATASQLTVLLLGPRPAGISAMSNRSPLSSASRSTTTRQGGKARGEPEAGGPNSARVASGGPGTVDSSGPSGDKTNPNRGHGRSTKSAEGRAFIARGESGGREDDGANSGASAARLAMETLRALGSMEQRGGQRNGEEIAKDAQSERVAASGERNGQGAPVAGGADASAVATASADGTDQAALGGAFHVVSAGSAPDSALDGTSSPAQVTAHPSKRAKTTQSSADHSGRTDMDVGEGTNTSYPAEATAVAAASSAVPSGQAAGAAAAANTGSTATVSGAGAVEANTAAATATSAANASKVCYRCDGCDDFPLQHVRYHCLVCADFDLCPGCYELFHGPNNQFQGGNVVMLGGHSTAHRMVALQVGGSCENLTSFVSR